MTLTVQQRMELAYHWQQKAQQDFESARSNFASNRFENAVRDLYFSVFHSFSSVLMIYDKGQLLTSHKAARTSLHRDFVRAGIISEPLGKVYDRLFEARQKADYTPISAFPKDVVSDYIQGVAQFLESMERITKKRLFELTKEKRTKTFDDLER